nr:MAG TPA: hypothetical protein [Corticoviridae sp.]
MCLSIRKSKYSKYKVQQKRLHVTSLRVAFMA